MINLGVQIWRKSGTTTLGFVSVLVLGWGQRFADVVFFFKTCEKSYHVADLLNKYEIYAVQYLNFPHKNLLVLIHGFG